MNVNYDCQLARIRIMGTVNQVMRELNLPAVVMDGVLSSVLSDIRSQATAELMFTEVLPKQETKEGRDNE